MPTLELRIQSDGLEFVGRDSGSLVDVHSAQWQIVLRRFLTFACVGRPLVLMSGDVPTVVRGFLNAQEIRIPKERWYHARQSLWCAFTTCCTQAVLDEIWESQEFQIGPLIVTSIENASPHRCLDIYLSRDQHSEALYGGNDGVWITWKNPPQLLKVQIESFVRSLAADVGWDFAVVC